MKLVNLFVIVSALICFVSCSSLHKEKQETPIKVMSDVSRNAESVYLTQNNLGEAVIVWTEQDTSEKEQKYCYFSLWDSLSNGFSERIEIPVEQTTAFHTEGMPKLAFKKSGEIIAIYEVKVKSEFNPYAGEIHYIVSENNGKTWSSPETVHASKAPHKGRSFFDVTVLNEGEIGTCWLGESSSKGGRPVVFARTNSENKFVNEMVVDSVACQCCRTAIYSDPDGMISIVYRDIINDSIRDISVTVSRDNGKTFSPPVCFSGDGWNINGCPHNGPDVVSDQNNIYAVWFTGASERGLYFAQLNKKDLKVEKERITENGRYIQLTGVDEKPIIVYNETYTKNEKTYSKIMSKSLLDMKDIEITQGNVQAHSPVGLYKNSTLLSCWLEKEDEINILKIRHLNIGNNN